MLVRRSPCKMSKPLGPNMVLLFPTAQPHSPHASMQAILKGGDDAINAVKAAVYADQNCLNSASTSLSASTVSISDILSPADSCE